MTAKIIDGKALATQINLQTKENISKMVAMGAHRPVLCVVLVGEDPASQVYVRNKIKTAAEVGMESREFLLHADISQQELNTKIQSLSNDDEIDGILLQLPLPNGLNANQAIEFIDPLKDVDGLTEKSAGKLLLGKDGLFACTPSGCIIIAKEIYGDLTGKNVVVIGRSILVGKPVALLFLQENCTVTIAHSKTENLEEVCKKADILVAAVGRPQMVKADWVKKGALVIDVGINRIQTNPDTNNGKSSKLVGDVDFDSAKEVAGFITPVPGGVGPMTIACLMANALKANILRKQVSGE